MLCLIVFLSSLYFPGRESFSFPMHDTRPYDRRKSSAIPDFLITNEESDAATSNLYAESFVVSTSLWFYPGRWANIRMTI